MCLQNRGRAATSGWVGGAVCDDDVCRSCVSSVFPTLKIGVDSRSHLLDPWYLRSICAELSYIHPVKNHKEAVKQPSIKGRALFLGSDSIGGLITQPAPAVAPLV